MIINWLLNITNNILLIFVLVKILALQQILLIIPILLLIRELPILGLLNKELLRFIFAVIWSILVLLIYWFAMFMSHSHNIRIVLFDTILLCFLCVIFLLIQFIRITIFNQIRLFFFSIQKIIRICKRKAPFFKIYTVIFGEFVIFINTKLL